MEFRYPILKLEEKLPYMFSSPNNNKNSRSEKKAPPPPI
jgi:hypothetical protein